MKIYEALNAVMRQVGAVKKGDRNSQQNYSFRGVDAVVNAVYPALLDCGVTVQPNVRSYDYGTVHVGSGSNPRPMGHARVVVEYTFTAMEDGSAVVTSAAGEAFDSGDKATPKAMSVALRTALLQSLMLPTDDPDPDAASYERVSDQSVNVTAAEVNEAKAAVKAAWEQTRGEFVMSEVENHYASEYDKRLGDATASELGAFAQDLLAAATVQDTLPKYRAGNPVIVAVEGEVQP